ncbi:GNAT family N-acetyltransferase [Loktanella sp. R86503]|uniref:GNAT family N-acetyltransferase n=1 Tax=Loktanella sp. R86503 TaxID=3093847 RepID=UPI0036D8575B
MRVTLAPYTSSQRDALIALAVAPEQEQFSDQPARLLNQPGDTADLHLIYDAAALVGMFRIDPQFARTHDFAPANAFGLRSVIVDRAHQGRGIGTAMIRALPAYLMVQYPAARQLYLTVNLRNPAARASYLRGGFHDTGAQYLGGDAGPQHILRLDLT